MRDYWSFCLRMLFLRLVKKILRAEPCLPVAAARGTDDGRSYPFTRVPRATARGRYEIVE